MSNVCNYKPAKDWIMGLDGYITDCGTFQYFKSKEDMPEECLVCDRKINIRRKEEENRTKNVVQEIFTLSAYSGTHRTDGYVGDYEVASFKESLGPLHLMIQKFRNVKLGSKIKVTMEIDK